MKTESLVLMIALLHVILASGCVQSDNNIEEPFIITDGMIIDPGVCIEKGISDKVIIFHSPTCPACQKIVPVLEDLEHEVDVEFEFIDLATERERAEELGLMPTHIPTVIIKCGVHVGYRTKKEFLDLIGG